MKNNDIELKFLSVDECNELLSNGISLNRIRKIDNICCKNKDNLDSYKDLFGDSCVPTNLFFF